MRTFPIYLISLTLSSAVLADDIKYTGASLRDPFALSVQQNPTQEISKSETRLKSLTIQGILLSQSPKAIIGGKIYQIGSVLEGAKVVQITREGVLVSVDNKEILIEQKIGKTSNETTKKSNS